MPTFHAIHTPRLTLRRFRAEDVPRFLTYRNDPEVTRYDGVGAITTEEANAFIRRQAILPAGEPGAWLQIAIELPGTGLIGDIGFQVDRDVVGTAEIGYRLAQRYWGQGYAAEAASGVLDWAFAALDVHRVVAIIDTRNARSIALAERLGFRREGHLLESYREATGWTDEFLFAMLDHEWRERR